ncbi:MAG: Uma2 family endonuclease [Vicinamibacterales bacterium]
MRSGSRTGYRLTYDDFVQFPDDGLRHEIIDGEHYVTPSPNRRHQRLLRRLLFALESYLRLHPGVGEIFVAPFDVVLSHWDIVEPDLLLIANDQQEILTPLHVKGAPALVVEILSPSTRKRDQRLKRELFERQGVREYWMVDPEANRVSIHRRLSEGSFPCVATPSAADRDVLTTPILPGFGLALDELFVE